MGRFRHALDEKRRVAIPKAVREAIDPARDGKAFYLLRAPGEPCLWLFPERQFASFVDTKIKPLLERQSGIGSKDVRGLVRSLLGSATRVEPDKQGRIVLPEELLVRTTIEREVEFVGLGDKVEVWSPALLKDRDDDQEFDRRALELFG